MVSKNINNEHIHTLIKIKKENTFEENLKQYQWEWACNVMSIKGWEIKRRTCSEVQTRVKIRAPGTCPPAAAQEHTK